MDRENDSALFSSMTVPPRRREKFARLCGHLESNNAGYWNSFFRPRLFLSFTHFPLLPLLSLRILLLRSLKIRFFLPPPSALITSFNTFLIKVLLPATHLLGLGNDLFRPARETRRMSRFDFDGTGCYFWVLFNPSLPSMTHLGNITRLHNSAVNNHKTNSLTMHQIIVFYRIK